MIKIQFKNESSKSASTIHYISKFPDYIIPFDFLCVICFYLNRLRLCSGKGEDEKYRCSEPEPENPFAGKLLTFLSMNKETAQVGESHPLLGINSIQFKSVLFQKFLS